MQSVWRRERLPSTDLAMLVRDAALLQDAAATVTMPAVPPRAAPGVVPPLYAQVPLPRPGCTQRCLCRDPVVCRGAFAASGLYAEVPLPRAGCMQRCLCRERVVCRGAFAASGLYASGAWACGGWGGIAYFVAIATGAGELPDHLLRGPVGVGVRRVDEVPVASDIGIEDRLCLVPSRSPAPIGAGGHRPQGKR